MGLKYPYNLKMKFKGASMRSQKEKVIKYKGLAQWQMSWGKVSKEMMRHAQEEDLEISKVRHYVMLARKPSLA